MENTPNVKANNKSAKQIRTRTARDKLDAKVIALCDLALSKELDREAVKMERRKRKQEKKQPRIFTRETAS